MSKSYFIALVALAHLAFSRPASATVHISEVMASNVETVADEDGDYTDWVELYNSGDSPFALGGFGLSDDPANPFRWVLPELVFAAGEYLLVFASDKNRRSPNGELHTNFEIASGGESLFLTAPDGVRVDEFDGREIPRDISAGRAPDGTGDWLYFDQPTPGASNDTAASETILAPPEFSHPPGFYSEAFLLTISAKEADVSIRYSLDGSTPTLESLEYLTPISIASRRGEPNTISRIRSGPPGDWSEWRGPAGEVFKATVLRAAAFREGAISSAPSTSNYFVDKSIHGRYGVPIISLATDPENLFSGESGIYVPGDYFDGVNFDTGNYYQRGSNWERPIHIALMDGDGTSRFSQDAGVRVHGGTTRRLSPKALSLFARSRYGNDSFDYPVFGDDDSDTFERLLLRTSGNDFGSTLIRDGLMQDLVADLGLDQQSYRPGVLFINGEYWGIHNIRERVDVNYLHQHHGVDPDNIDLLSNDRVVKAGDRTHYDEMLLFLEENDISASSNYEHLQTLMDTDNFSTYSAVEIYFANTDWPHGNIDYWRHRTDSYMPDSPQGQDGRWRWILFDTDYGFALDRTSSHTTNALRLATDENAGWSTFLLRSLLKNDTFRTDFINRLADYMNTIFRPSAVVERIDTFRDRIAPLMPEHIARWGYPKSMEQWDIQVDGVLVPFAEQRPFYMRDHIVTHFGLEGEAEVTLEVPDPRRGQVRINSIILSGTTNSGCLGPDPSDSWSGVYFQGIPVEIEAIPAPGYVFDHWQGLPTGTSALTTMDLPNAVSIVAHFREIPRSDDGGGCFPDTLLSLPRAVKRYFGDIFILAFGGMMLLARPRKGRRGLW